MYFITQQSDKFIIENGLKAEKNKLLLLDHQRGVSSRNISYFIDVFIYKIGNKTEKVILTTW